LKSSDAAQIQFGHSRYIQSFKELRKIELEKYKITKKSLEIKARWLKLEEDKLAREDARSLYELQKEEKCKALVFNHLKIL
jgi:hypothetical protein